MLAACGRFDFAQHHASDAAPEIDAIAIDAPPPAAPVLGDHMETEVGAAQKITAKLSVQAGDLIVAAFGYDQTDGSTIATITDSQGNSYAVLGPADGGDGNREYLAYGIATGSGTDVVTAAVTGTTATYTTLRLHDYAHVDAATPLDVSAMGAAILPAQPDATLVTTHANDVMIAFVIVNGGGANAATGWNAVTVGAGDLTEDRIAPTAGAQTISAIADFGKWTLICAAFRGD